MFTSIWVSAFLFSFFCFLASYICKQLPLRFFYRNGQVVSMIVMVFLFYLVGFPRKQTGKNVYFRTFYCKDINMPVGNPVTTHTRSLSSCWRAESSRWGEWSRFYWDWCAATQLGPQSLGQIYSPQCTHTQNEGQRGPFSEGGPSQPFTVNRTVAFHCRGRYRQRQPYIASQGSCQSLAL